MKRFIYFAILIPLVLSVALIACQKPQEKSQTKKSKDNSVVEKAKDKVETKGVEGLPSFSSLVQKLKPSVVNISTTSMIHQRGFSFKSPFGGRENDPFEDFFKQFFGDIPQREFKQRGLGSGFIISEDGYIVTNNHVIDKAEDIDVILEDSEKYKAKIVGRDPKTDL
ncbi:MAG: trypsin-like peptidase domain-containing protein, partial [Thermodesulfobacteriota bacterium]